MSTAELFINPREVKQPRLVSERERIRGYGAVTISVGGQMKQPTAPRREGLIVSADVKAVGKVAESESAGEVIASDSFSAVAHRLFWVGGFLLVTGVLVNLIALVFEQVWIGGFGSALMAGSFIFLVAWYDRIHVERPSNS